MDLVLATTSSARVTKINSLNTFEINGQKKVNLYGISEGIYNDLSKFKSEYIKKNELFVGNERVEPKLVTDIENEIKKDEVIHQLDVLILNKEVLLKEVYDNTYLIYLNGNEKISINEFLLLNGYVVMADNLNGSAIDLDLVNAQNNAKNNKLGLWDINYSSQSVSEWGDTHIENIHPIIIIIIIFYSIAMIISVYMIKKKPGKMYLLNIFVSLIGLISLINIIRFSNHNIMILFLVLVSLFTIYLAIYLLKFILAYKSNMSIIFLIQFIIGICAIVIYYFASVYMCFDNPSNVHIAKYNFITNQQISSETNKINTHLSLGSNGGFYNYFLDFIYFSGTTFFGGSYGDVTPKGYLRIIVLVEMLISFLLQLVFFSIVFNLIYEKLTASHIKNSPMESGKVLANAKDNLKGNSKNLQNVTVVDKVNNSMEPQEGGFKERNVKKTFFVVLAIGLTLLVNRFFRK
ncbi:ion channel [Bacillus fungorum]|uniref:ion channel n=1 Tax=Bacillus fungorum TaxID=2039284 RepID=UPI003F57649A